MKTTYIVITVLIVLALLALIVYLVNKNKTTIPTQIVVQTPATNQRQATPANAPCTVWDEIIYQNYANRSKPKEIAKRGCGKYYRVIIGFAPPYEPKLIEITKAEFDALKSYNDNNPL